MSRFGMWVQRAYLVPQKTHAITLVFAAVAVLYATAAVSVFLYRLDGAQPREPTWVGPDANTSVLLYSTNEVPLNSKGARRCTAEDTIYTCVQAELRR